MGLVVVTMTDGIESKVTGCHVVVFTREHPESRYCGCGEVVLVSERRHFRGSQVISIRWLEALSTNHCCIVNSGILLHFHSLFSLWARGIGLIFIVYLTVRLERDFSPGLEGRAFYSRAFDPSFTSFSTMSSWQNRKRPAPDSNRPLAPFTTDSQMYLTVSNSDKNKGRYYYGYDSQFLKWVPTEKLGHLITTLQSDGKKWYFAPGVIDPEVSDKLTLSTAQPQPPTYNLPGPLNQAQTYNPNPQYQQQPQPQQQQPQQPSQHPQQIVQQNWKAATNPAYTVVENTTTSHNPQNPQNPPLPLKELIDEISDLREILAHIRSSMQEFNQQYKIGLSLKRQRMTEGLSVMHPVPGNFHDSRSDDGDSGEEPGDEEKP